MIVISANRRRRCRRRRRRRRRRRLGYTREVLHVTGTRRWVPVGIVCSSGFSSEDVWSIWSHR